MNGDEVQTWKTTWRKMSGKAATRSRLEPGKKARALLLQQHAQIRGMDVRSFLYCRYYDGRFSSLLA